MGMGRSSQQLKEAQKVKGGERRRIWTGDCRGAAGDRERLQQQHSCDHQSQFLARVWNCF